MENFIAFINDSIKVLEEKDLGPQEKSLLASRLDSVCALLSMTIYNLNQKNEQNEKS